MMKAETLRAACGGALDGLSDEAVETLGALALEYACAYTGRALEYDDYEEEIPMKGRTALLRAWPVEELREISVDGVPVDIKSVNLDAARGVMRLPMPGTLCRVVYTGGCDPLPAPIVCACAMLAASLAQAADNGGQQITYQALDGYQVTYASKNAAGDALEMLSPVAAILLRPYCARQVVRGLA